MGGQSDRVWTYTENDGVHAVSCGHLQNLLGCVTFLYHAVRLTPQRNSFRDQLLQLLQCQGSLLLGSQHPGFWSWLHIQNGQTALVLLSHANGVVGGCRRDMREVSGIQDFLLRRPRFVLRCARSNRQNRAWRLTKNRFGHGTKQDPPKTRTAMRANHNQVNGFLLNKIKEGGAYITIFDHYFVRGASESIL